MAETCARLSCARGVESPRSSIQAHNRSANGDTEFLGRSRDGDGIEVFNRGERGRVLVDCGLFQGLKELREKNWEDPPFDPKSLDAVIITHAHIDHTGYLPRLVALGFNNPVYCSKGTAALLKLLLPDSARLQEEEADYRNRKGLTRHKPALPLYTEDDARATLKLMRTCPSAGEPTEVAPGMRAGVHVAGHILGSSLVLVEIDGAGTDGGGRRVLFSGDLGHYDQPIIRDPDPPPACDYMLVESTYGDREHDAEDPKVALARVINEGIERGGPVLFPAFAIGRTQELFTTSASLKTRSASRSFPSAWTRRWPRRRRNLQSPRGGARRGLCDRPQGPPPPTADEFDGDGLFARRIEASKTSAGRASSSALGNDDGRACLHHAMRILRTSAHRRLRRLSGRRTTGRRILDASAKYAS